MKRFLVLAFLGATFVAQAGMIELPSRIRPGFRVGLNAATQSTSKSSSLYSPYGNSGIIGFVAGGFVELPLAARVSLIPELDFVMKGTKFEPFVGNSYTDHLNYLELPILVKLHWDWPAVSVFAKFGPEMGILLSATSSDTGTGVSSDVKGRYHSLDAGITVGGGCVLPLGERISAEFEGRMGIGFLDVDATPTTSRNFDVQLTAGLLF